jgi:hypothetical protein
LIEDAAVEVALAKIMTSSAIKKKKKKKKRVIRWQFLAILIPEKEGRVSPSL